MTDLFLKVFGQELNSNNNEQELEGKLGLEENGDQNNDEGKDFAEKIKKLNEEKNGAKTDKNNILANKTVMAKPDIFNESINMQP